MEPDNQENQNAEQLDTAGDAADNQQQQQQQQSEVPAWQAILFQQRQDQQRNAERLAQIEAENQRLQQQLQQQQQQQQQPLPTDVLMNNPDAFRQAINQDIQRQVAPLNQFTQEMQRQQAYRIAKGQMLRDPQLGPVINNVGPFLDDYFLNTPTAQPTIAAITSKVKEIIADYVLAGGLQNQNNQVQNQNQNQNNQANQNNQGQQIVNPPHLRPSSRPTNQPQNTNQQQSFDENERRLMRENGYTPGEYLMLRDSDPSKAAEVWKTIKDARAAGKRIQ